MCTTIFSTAMPRNDDAWAVAQLTVTPEGVSNKQSHAQHSMAEKAYYLSSVIPRIRVLYKHTACEEAMEQWVRVRTEQDRQLLKWLIETIGEAAIVKAAHGCARGVSSATFNPAFSPRRGRRTAPPSDLPHPAVPAHPCSNGIVIDALEVRPSTDNDLSETSRRTKSQSVVTAGTARYPTVCAKICVANATHWSRHENCLPPFASCRPRTASGR